MSTQMTGQMTAHVDTDGDLVLDHVSYQPGPLLLDDVSVSFPAGRVTALSGPSGSGKTTLLSIAGGLIGQAHPVEQVGDARGAVGLLGGHADAGELDVASRGRVGEEVPGGPLQHGGDPAGPQP